MKAWVGMKTDQIQLSMLSTIDTFIMMNLKILRKYFQSSPLSIHMKSIKVKIEEFQKVFSHFSRKSKKMQVVKIQLRKKWVPSKV